MCHKEAAANMLRCMLRRMLSFPFPASLMLAMLTFLNPPVPKYRLIRAPMSSYDTSAYVTCGQQPLLVQHEYIQLLRSLITFPYDGGTFQFNSQWMPRPNTNALCMPGPSTPWSRQSFWDRPCPNLHISLERILCIQGATSEGI